jgi:hypothetical protein
MTMPTEHKLKMWRIWANDTVTGPMSEAVRVYVQQIQNALRECLDLLHEERQQAHVTLVAQAHKIHVLEQYVVAKDVPDDATRRPDVLPEVHSTPEAAKAACERQKAIDPHGNWMVVTAKRSVADLKEWAAFWSKHPEGMTREVAETVLDAVTVIQEADAMCAAHEEGFVTEGDFRRLNDALTRFHARWPREEPKP